MTRPFMTTDRCHLPNLPLYMFYYFALLFFLSEMVCPFCTKGFSPPLEHNVLPFPTQVYWSVLRVLIFPLQHCSSVYCMNIGLSSLWPALSKKRPSLWYLCGFIASQSILHSDCSVSEGIEAISNSHTCPRLLLMRGTFPSSFLRWHPHFFFTFFLSTILNLSPQRKSLLTGLFPIKSSCHLQSN